MNNSTDRQEEIETARRMVKQWIAAEEAVMTGQEYRIGTRSLKRADLRDIGERIKYWKDELARLECATRMRVRQIVHRNT
jgi:hypothetical protein